MEVIIGQIYRHFKGNLYKVICIAEDSETGKNLVIYQALYGENKIYARPYEMFVSKVDKIKYPDATSEYRFTLWDGSSNTCAFAEPVNQKVSTKEEDKTEKTAEPESTEESESEAENHIHPEVMAFLDERDFEKKLGILQGMSDKITDEMLNIMAYSIDVDLNEGTTYDKYNELLNCIMLRAKFECSRLR